MRHLSFTKFKWSPGYYLESNNLVNPTQYEIIDGGACITTAIAEEYINATKNHKLLQNYPNPFHQETQIKFNISGQEKVRLNVYNMAGKEVAIIVNETLNAGEYNVLFSAKDLPAGVYYYQLRAGEFLDTKKLIVSR